jgi:pimeloyl-ACP methyl ester carboxylesterase
VEDLASHGYTVVTIDHTYETAVEFPGGRLVEADLLGDPPDIEATKRLFMDTREADVHFVLDQLRDEPADLTRIGMFGHSAGGVIATRVMRADSRVRADANLDGFFEFGQNHPERGVDRPFLLMGAAPIPSSPRCSGRFAPTSATPGGRLSGTPPPGRDWTSRYLAAATTPSPTSNGGSPNWASTRPATSARRHRTWSTPSATYSDSCSTPTSKDGHVRYRPTQTWKGSAEPAKPAVQVCCRVVAAREPRRVRAALLVEAGSAW